jgi:hypothetical protein
MHEKLTLLLQKLQEKLENQENLEVTYLDNRTFLVEKLFHLKRIYGKDYGDPLVLITKINK